MKRVLLSIGVGILAPFVFILGASPFEVPGQNTPKEILAGSVVVLLHSAFCEFWIAGKLVGPPRARWPIPVTTVLSFLVVAALLALQGGLAWLFSGLPIFVSGCLGVAAGLLLLTRRSLVAPPSHVG